MQTCCPSISFAYSLVNGNNESDIDICILTNNNNKKLQIIRTIKNALYDNVSKPVDLLVYKTKEFYDRAAAFKSFEREIADSGVLL